MDTATRQFLYRWCIVTICLIVAAVVAVQLAAVFVFGDGEGIRLVDELRPLAMEIVAGMLGVLGLTKVMDTRETVNGQNTVQTAAPADAPVPAVSVAAVPVPAAASPAPAAAAPSFVAPALALAATAVEGVL